MVLTKSELIAALQNEVHILVHLASKIDRTQLDYRPTPKQRSTIELLRYLTLMGPALTEAALTGAFDRERSTAAGKAAAAWDLDQIIAAIAAQAETYARLLADVSDARFREELDGLGAGKMSRGAFIVNRVLGGYAAYRTQLFLYLKAGGREELGTTNLWSGVDAPVTV